MLEITTFIVHPMSYDDDRIFSASGECSHARKIRFPQAYSAGFNDNAHPDEAQGLNNTANLAALYENFGWSGRRACNRCGACLGEANAGNSNSPRHVDEYSPVDLNVGRDVTDNLTVFFGRHKYDRGEYPALRSGRAVFFFNDVAPINFAVEIQILYTTDQLL